jgi:hypothetical protein
MNYSHLDFVGRSTQALVSTEENSPEVIGQKELHAECANDWQKRVEIITSMFLEILSSFTESLSTINRSYKIPCPYGTYLEGSSDAFNVEVENISKYGAASIGIIATIKLLRPLTPPPKGSSYTCHGTSMPIPGFSDELMAKLERVYDSACGGLPPIRP